jgi:hypothetical protein
MAPIKYELQSIIIGNGQDGNSSQLKKNHNFLRRNAEASSEPKKQKRLKSEEESLLIDFALKENFIYSESISRKNNISLSHKWFFFDINSLKSLRSLVRY